VSSVTPAESVTFEKSEVRGIPKQAPRDKTPGDRGSPSIETKGNSKVQESPNRVESKPRAKPDTEKNTKENPTELASLKPTKPAEVSVPPPVAEVRLVALTVLAERKELNVDSRIPLTVKGKYSDGRENEINGTVRWESSDRNIAVVNSRGELEARKEGRAEITASYSGLTSPRYTFFIKGVPQPEKPPSNGENIQDLRRRLLR
jgi:hypothetical protein